MKGYSTMNEQLNRLYDLLKQCESLTHTMQILNYDMETQAPKKGMADDARDISYLSAQSFAIRSSKEFKDLVTKLKEDIDSLDQYDQRLITLLDREITSEKNVTPEFDKERTELFNQAYITWIEAKDKNDYSLFKDTLKKIYELEKRYVELQDNYDKDNLYNTLLSGYEFGFTTKDLDPFFDELEKGLVPLLKEVRSAKYQPRHDFLRRKVAIGKQAEFSEFLMKFNGFDFERGSLSTTEHPFTEQFSYNDVRITTHYFEDNFLSNMFSIIHEGGHALFGQNIKEDVFLHHLGEGSLSMAKHESVSRFYENVIGRSREYIHAIYPEFKKIFHDEMADVTEDDLYEGANYIDFDNPLRTEADELTYSLHILIRYRLEKKIMEGKADFEHLNEEWNRLYKEYLGIDVNDDKTGILQDVHWSSGFGYFPTYSMGNALNCIYTKKMEKEIGMKEKVREGKMNEVLNWMKDNVFASAPLYDTKTWIHNLTGEDFSAKDYVEYLNVKFRELYHL